LFFKSVASVNPHYRTPHIAIGLNALWAAALVFSGTYDQLFNYVIFASWIFYGLAGLSVIVLRRTHPEVHRPYRTLGYPVLPVLFVIGSLALILNTLYNPQSRSESIRGLVLIFAGIPLYWYWSRRSRAS
jgi:APA family basic amino acid/polyamine antiporter